MRGKGNDGKQIEDVDARRVGCVTNASASSRCCTKDGSRPPEVGLQEQASNLLVLLRSKRRGSEQLREKTSDQEVR